MNVRKEIHKFADDNDKPVLLWLLSKYNMSSAWRFVTNCIHLSYGTQSYQMNRKWIPTIEGRILYQAHKKGEYNMK